MTRNPLHRAAAAGTPSATPVPDADHLLVVLSDIEMGAGGPTDDFPQTEFLGDLLLRYNEPPYVELAVTVVFNGDTLDLLKTSFEGAYPARITAAIALAKLERILAAHSTFFDQLGDLLAHQGAQRRLVFVAGNHDLELLFPQVQSRLKERIGHSESIEFAGHFHAVGDVLIEHGSQTDPLFATDPNRPFIKVDGEDVLNIPWGTLALLEVALPQTHSVLYALDRLRPRRKVLERLPEVRELLMQSYWHYWTREFWRGALSRKDQLHHVSWAMAKEVVYRLFTGDPDLAASDARALLVRDGPTRTYALGHQHSAGFWSQEKRCVLQTGCFRNEYLFDATSAEHEHLASVYAEIFLERGRTVRAHLVEVDAPAPLEPAVPKNVTDVLPAVRRQLRALKEA